MSHRPTSAQLVRPAVGLTLDSQVVPPFVPMTIRFGSPSPTHCLLLSGYRITVDPEKVHDRRRSSFRIAQA